MAAYDKIIYCLFRIISACSSGDPRSHLQPSTPQKAAPPPAIATQLPPLTTASVTTTQQMMVVGKSLGLGNNVA